MLLSDDEAASLVDCMESSGCCAWVSVRLVGDGFVQAMFSFNAPQQTSYDYLPKWQQVGVPLKLYERPNDVGSVVNGHHTLDARPNTFISS
jgi:hypothetical protein